MAARVLHIGIDYCHRVPVLESAGYRVDGCCSVVELRQALGNIEVLEAVLVSESEGAAHQDMIREVKERSAAPVVIFRETLRNCEEITEAQLFDMEVPVLEPPDAWLTDLAELIACSRELQARLRVTRNKSQQLCQEIAALRERSQRERQRSKEVRRKIPHPAGFVRGPEDGEND